MYQLIQIECERGIPGCGNVTKHAFDVANEWLRIQDDKILGIDVFEAHEENVLFLVNFKPTTKNRMRTRIMD